MTIDNPMPRLRKLALETHESTEEKRCGCYVVYYNRLYRFVGRDPLISEYCDRHHPWMKKEGVTE